MKSRPNLLAFLITLVYWIPSTILLFSIVEGSGSIFPSWLDLVLAPGYILGFALGFGGGNFFALLGQLISLILIFLFVRMFTSILK
jgi:hypothetical protein